MEIEKNDINKLSEIAYSLGYLDPKDRNTKEALRNIVDTSDHVEPVAHALLALQNMLTPDDLGWLENHLQRLSTTRLKFSA